MPRHSPVDFDEGRAFSSNRWHKRYRKILILYEEGKQQKEIAKQTGYSLSRISAVINSPMFAKALSEIRKGIDEEVRNVFKQHALGAARRIVRIADRGKPNQRIQLEASKEILYQIGLKPKETVETLTRDYTPQEIASALETVKELENITGRLEAKDSKFLVSDAPAEETPQGAPSEGAEETGSTGQATMPA